MSLINCPECKKEVSNTVENCIHCGYSISGKITSELNSSASNKEVKKNKSSESQIHKLIDAVFALLYVYLFYIIFFSDSFSGTNSVASWFGVFFAFVMIYFVQKMAKAIFGTVGRSFDNAFNKKNT